MTTIELCTRRGVGGRSAKEENEKLRNHSRGWFHVSTKPLWPSASVTVWAFTAVLRSSPMMS